MNSKLVKALIFVAGAAVGSAVTWKLVKTKYEQIAQEEIDSVKEVFSQQRREMLQQDQTVENDNDETESGDTDNESTESIIHGKNYHKPSLTEYAQRVSREGYSEQISVENSKEGGFMMAAKPYVIPPGEFATEAEYDLVELKYFADNVLTDSWGNPISDDEAEEMIGLDSLNHFGEYERDSVHVRNDVLKTDYEILADACDFEDFNRSDPDTVTE